MDNNKQKPQINIPCQLHRKWHQKQEDTMSNKLLQHEISNKK
jgi:hypothetical protein